MRVHVFGAGASAGTLGLPSTRGFGATLRVAHPDWELHYPHLAEVVRGLGNGCAGAWDLGAAWTRLDYLAKLGWALGTPADLGPADLELRRALLDVYGQGRRALHAALADAPSQTAAKLLEQARPGDAIISFNYDVLVEHLAAKAGLKLVQAPCDACRPAKHSCVQLIKPHGSLSWALHRDGRHVRLDWRAKDGGPLTEPLLQPQVSHAVLPLVVGVVPIKSELLREVQLFHDAPEVHQTIISQWRAAVEAVRRADEVVVVGYSFPLEDQYGGFLFHEAARSRSSQAPLRVEFFELESNAFEIARRLVDVFGVWPNWRRAV